MASHEQVLPRPSNVRNGSRLCENSSARELARIIFHSPDYSGFAVPAGATRNLSRAFRKADPAPFPDGRGKIF